MQTITAKENISHDTLDDKITVLNKQTEIYEK